jgi:hypothetical protein
MIQDLGSGGGLFPLKESISIFWDVSIATFSRGKNHGTGQKIESLFSQN